jgi:peptidoglycan/xylan/chitin deacetylase (PgdA/CDA1 family)
MLGLAVVSLGAFVYAGYHTMAPRSQLYGRTFIGVDVQTRQLALTFDDGPNDPHTLKLLDILAKHSVKATFFLIGRYVEQRPEIVREIVAAGHVVGNHTYSHPNLIFQSQAEVRNEVSRCEQALEDAVGKNHAPLFRPPFGARRPATLRTLKKAGLTPIMWSVTGYDWRAKSPNEVEYKVSKQIRGGDVILLHDGGHRNFGTDRSYTVQATDRLLARYKGEGYVFPTIPEMMSARTGNPESFKHH